MPLRASSASLMSSDWSSSTLPGASSVGSAIESYQIPGKGSWTRPRRTSRALLSGSCTYRNSLAVCTAMSKRSHFTWYDNHLSRVDLRRICSSCCLTVRIVSVPYCIQRVLIRRDCTLPSEIPEISLKCLFLFYLLTSNKRMYIVCTKSSSFSF